ncbi:SHD1 domain-containing protein [Aeoliella sp.]|uniref:SHD1 domain-containing protein n=1 Tax=Aeoliella sp. TaxID=2795800 RepID=UPI003CCBA7D8
MTLRITILLLVLPLFVPSCFAESRTWTAASGGASIEAEYVGAKDGNVTLRKADGKTVSVPIAKLSAADQQYIEQQTGGGSTAGSSAEEAVLGGDSGVRVEVVGLEFGKATPEIPEEQGEMMVRMGFEGTAVHLWLYDAERSFLGIDDQASKVTKLTDDLGTDLLKDTNPGGGFSMPGFSMGMQSNPVQADVAEHRHRCDVQISGPNPPAKGAKQIMLDAVLVARFGGKTEQVEAPAVKLAQGAEYQLGPIKFAVERLEKDSFFDEDKLVVVLKTEDSIDVLQKVEFLDADGNVLEHAERGSMSGGGFGTQINYAFSQELDTLGMRLHYFKDVDTVEVPVKLSTGVGF